jgi:hypothetical protein
VFILSYVGAISIAIGVAPAFFQIASSFKTGNSTGAFSGLFAIAAFVLILIGYLRTEEPAGFLFTVGFLFAILSFLTALVATFKIRVQD